MSPSECSSCNTPIIGVGKFCGTCGAPIAASHPTPDPLGRVAGQSQTKIHAPAAPADSTLAALGIPSANLDGGKRPSRTPAEMDWIEGAIIAGLALLPGVLIGTGLFVALRDSGLGLPAGIGIAASLLYGGSVEATGGASAFVAAASGSLSIVAYSLTLLAVSGLVLWGGARRALRRANTSDIGSCLRSVTPATVFFIVGALVLSLFAREARWVGTGYELAVSSSPARVVFISGLLTVLSVGVAVLSKMRFSNESLRDLWSKLSAPTFALAALVLLCGSLAVLGVAIAAVVAGGWEWNRLLLIPAGVASFLELALTLLSLGTLSSIVATADGSAEAQTSLLSDSSLGLPAGAYEGFNITQLFGTVPWLGALILVMVSAIGILAAGLMILRRRDASVARRDFGVWMAGAFVLGLVTTVLVGYRASFEGEATFLSGSGAGLVEAGVGVPISAILLLPLFAAGWWLVARVALPRLPAQLLLRLSAWARAGL